MLTHDASVVVIGLGGVGAAALDVLARRGVVAIGVEQYQVGHDRGSSHGRTRVIRTAYVEDQAYVPVLQRAWSLWRELDHDARQHTADGAPLLEATGVVNVFSRGDPRLAALRAGIAAHGLQHEVLDAVALAARTPIVPGTDDVGVLEAQGGLLRVERCVRALVDRARAHGAHVIEGDAVVDVDASAPGRVVVRLASGAIVRARAAVVAAGAFGPSRAATRALYAHLPLSVVRQVQLWFAPTAPLDHLPCFIHFTASGAFYGLPPRDGAGVKVCQHHAGAAADADQLDRALHDEDVAPVWAYVRAHLPAANGTLLEHRACMYTNTPDEHFAIGPHRDAPHVVVASACSGHGFKLAVTSGELAADLATGRSPALDVALFSPRRFA